jgi:predicted acylesterase/phospholipase RssA
VERVALQVGALNALLEAGYRPDMVVGTSITALNAAFLGLHGFNAAALTNREAVWHDAVTANLLLPANYIWLTLRALLGLGDSRPEDRIAEFLTRMAGAPW